MCEVRNYARTVWHMRDRDRERNRGMKKFPLLATLMGVCMALVVAVSPASANVEADGNTSQGPYTIFSIEFDNTGVVACTTIQNGEWHIQKSEPSQELTKQGGHLELTGDITKCTEEVGGIKSNAKINPTCSQQLKQVSEKSFTGSVSKNCSITRGSCVLTVAAGAPNTELKEIKVVNITGGNEETSSVTGITSTANKACEELGISGNKEGTVKARAIATGAKVI
jgi:hypothetical protein